MRLGPVWGSSGRRRGGAWNPGVPRKWGRPPLPGQDPFNQPKTPPVPSPPLAPCGAWLLLPRAAGPDGQRCPGAGEMPACRGSPRAALSSSSSLPGQHPPPPRSSLPSGPGSPGDLRCCPRPGCDLQPRESPAEGGDGGDWHHQAPPGQSRRSRLSGRGLASSRQLRAFCRRFALD